MSLEIGSTKLQFAFFGQDGYLHKCIKYGAYSQHSIRAKRIDLTLFLDFVMKTNPKPTLNAITAEVLLTYVTHLSLNYSPASIVRRIATVRHFFSTTQREYNHPCPLTKWPRVYVSAPPIERISEIRLRQIREELSGHDYRSLMESAMFETILHSGLRASEVISLQTHCINFSASKFERVLRKGKKIQDVYFAEQLTHYLRPYLAERARLGIKSKLLFCYESGKKVNYEALKRLMQKVGYQAHLGRHEFVSTVYEKTNDLAFTCNRAGHSDPKTTMRYIHRETNTINDKLNGAFLK